MVKISKQSHVLLEDRGVVLIGSGQECRVIQIGHRGHFGHKRPTTLLYLGHPLLLPLAYSLRDHVQGRTKVLIVATHPDGTHDDGVQFDDCCLRGGLVETVD